MESKISDLHSLQDSLKEAKNLEDFLIVQANIANFFSKLKKEEKEEIIKAKDNFYINSFENVFNNFHFIETVGKVLEQYKSFQKNFDNTQGANFFSQFNNIEIKNKKLIFTSFIVSLMPLLSIIEELSHESLSYSATKLQSCISKLVHRFKDKYSQQEMYIVLSSVFNKKFHSPPSTLIKINDIYYLYKYQKISNYLLSMLIRLSFRNSQLNNLFKGIERNKINDKFTIYNISRIAEMIKREKENEIRSIAFLSTCFNKPIIIDTFLSTFKKDKNVYNAFNLIDISLKFFQLDGNFEENLLKTITNSQELINEIKKYGKENFKAFSGSIDENNFEWSNKIYINCSKLIGALSCLSDVKDRRWLVGASMKEFVDWTTSIHKVLNKHDIEDDWDKISKYLDQETNKIEWKSTFLTPTQLISQESSQAEVSKKIFFGIIKTILGMLNSDGGVIIIGVVEKPEDITDNEIRDSLLEKNKKFFLDVKEELQKRKLDLDGVKRKIQDSLKIETLMTADVFNNLWGIQELNIKSTDGIREIAIYKIEVSKSEKYIYSIKSEKEIGDKEVANINKSENLWVSLLKRADARTIYVDPRKYLSS